MRSPTRIFDFIINALQPRTHIMLKAGDKAPDFTAATTDGTTISLHDYQGRNNVVLFFYPEDDTAGCTREACAFRDARPRYDEANTVVFGVSLDDQASHQRFTEKYSLNYQLIVDEGGKICEAYGVPVNGTHARRVSFLIDTDGVIRNVWEQVNVTTHADDVLAEIAAMGHS